ncbi:MAG: anthranilate synthase component I family protein, partial [Thermoanaerobaculum sp.]
MRVRFALGPGFGGDGQVYRVEPAAVLYVREGMGFWQVGGKRRAVADPLSFLEKELEGGKLVALGFLAYELAPYLEPLVAVCQEPLPLPRAFWALVDLQEAEEDQPQSFASGNSLHCSLTSQEFCHGVEVIRRAIGEGSVYQVNLTRRWEVTFSGDPAGLFQRLGGENTPRFSFFLQDQEQGWAILGLSPELFLKRQGEVLESWPIKGTWWGEDPAQAGEKEHAELATIVDLVRHDLGRVCRPGSVEVVAPWRPVQTRDVVHREAVVRGQLREGISLGELLQATFPGGSVTGAPKLAACQRIAELEPVPRSVYCGACGVFQSSGAFTLAMPIRTGYVAGGRLYFHAGAGIVWDSEPCREEQETR